MTRYSEESPVWSWYALNDNYGKGAFGTAPYYGVDFIWNMLHNFGGRAVRRMVSLFLSALYGKQNHLLKIARRVSPGTVRASSSCLKLACCGAKDGGGPA